MLWVLNNWFITFYVYINTYIINIHIVINKQINVLVTNRKEKKEKKKMSPNKYVCGGNRAVNKTCSSFEHTQITGPIVHIQKKVHLKKGCK